MNKISAFTFAAGLIASSATAKVSFSLDIEALTQSDGINAISGNGLVVLVVDTGNDGFQLPSAGSITSGNDEIVTYWDLNEYSFTSSDITLVSEGGVTYGENWKEDDKLALFWFPTLSSSNMSPAADSVYGVFADAAGLASGDTWLMPSDGTLLHSLKLFTAAASKLVMFGDQPNSVGKAAFAVNNPPSTGAPSSPSLGVTNGGGKSTLTWTTSGSTTGYIVQRKKANGSWESIGLVDGSDTSFEDTDVRAGFQYQYRLYSLGSFAFSQSNIPSPLISERSVFVNLAARAHIDPDSSNRDWTLLNAGVVLSGVDPLKRMLGLGIGPRNGALLTDQDWLEDPTMLLEIGGVTVAENDNWMRDEIDGSQLNPDVLAIETAMQARGTPVLPADDATTNFIGRDTAIIEDFSLGSNLLKVFSKELTAQEGFVGLQVYDAEYVGFDNPPIRDNRIVNLSAKGYLATDGIFNGSLVISGSVPKEVLVLARGPALTIKGVAGALEDPVLFLRRGSDTLLTNDNWDEQVATTFESRGLLKTETDMTRIRAAITSIGQNPDEHTLDSAMLVTLAPGAGEGYIFKVESAPGSTITGGTVQIQINEIEME